MLFFQKKIKEKNYNSKYTYQLLMPGGHRRMENLPENKKINYL